MFRSSLSSNSLSQVYLKGFFVTALSLGVLASCGKKESASSGSTNAGACNVTASATCIDYTGSSYTSTIVEQACSQTSSTYLASGCSATDRVGSCTVNTSGPELSVKYRYYSPTFNASTAEASCTTLSGTFEAS